MFRIRVIDFETTGMEPPAEVIEVGFSDLVGDGSSWEITDPISWLCGVKDVPPETRAVHHISLAEVEGLEPFGTDEESSQEILADSVDMFAAHNWAFEEQWVNPIIGDLPTLCTLKSALRIWPDAPGHSNGVLRYWLEDRGLILPDHDKTMPPHRAGPDAYVTAHILKALLNQATGRQMAAWTKEPRLLPRITIGKQKGSPWPEVETGFLQWMLRQPEMEYDLRWNAQRELNRRIHGE